MNAAHHRLTSVVALTLLALAGAVSLTAPTPSALAAPADEPKLPDTQPARVAAAFLAAVNAGTDEAVRAFESANASKKRLSSVPMDERITRLKGLKQRWGTLRIVEVLESSDSAISLFVEGSAGINLQMDFVFEPSEPGKLDGVMIADNAARPTRLSADDRASLVEEACTALEKGYVYPDLGKKMADTARAKLKAGDYSALTTNAALARRLTEDFRAVSNDRHLSLSVAAPQREQPKSDPTNKQDHEHEEREMLVRMAGENFAFRKVEVLSGNIGYIKFDLFVNHPEAEKAASAALAFTQNADALIFDLRSNGGGSPEMIRFITSYLFDKPTHLNDMVDRDGKVVSEYWTLEHVPGKRFAPDLPVYVLTSSRTFSGAEEFSYNLKNLKRATIIGETTGGGAHPIRGERLGDHLMMRVPFRRARNPISQTNWEGTGVAPDIQTPADKALNRAIQEAQGAIKARQADRKAAAKP